MLGGLTLTGVPLLAGFAPHWQLLRSVAEVNPIWPVLIVLGGLGVAVGYLRGLRAALCHPPQNQTGRPAGVALTLQEPPLLLFMIGLLGIICISLGLFPSLLVEPLQQLASGISIPIQ
jgi:formate hydrogenlyase subunit 3/multisubunit Na+/H+ antiporter MnhD subunit